MYHIMNVMLFPLSRAFIVWWDLMVSYYFDGYHTTPGVLGVILRLVPSYVGRQAPSARSPPSILDDPIRTFGAIRRFDFCRVW